MTQKSIKVTNPGGITENTYIYVGSEEMFVEKVVGDRNESKESSRQYQGTNTCTWYRCLQYH